MKPDIKMEKQKSNILSEFRFQIFLVLFGFLEEFVPQSCFYISSGGWIRVQKPFNKIHCISGKFKLLWERELRKLNFGRLTFLSILLIQDLGLCHFLQLLLVGRLSCQQFVSQNSNAPRVDFFIVRIVRELLGANICVTSNDGAAQGISEHSTTEVADLQISLDKYSCTLLSNKFSGLMSLWIISYLCIKFKPQQTWSTKCAVQLSLIFFFPLLDMLPSGMHSIIR